MNAEINVHSSILRLSFSQSLINHKGFVTLQKHKNCLCHHPEIMWMWTKYVYIYRNFRVHWNGSMRFSTHLQKPLSIFTYYNQEKGAVPELGWVDKIQNNDKSSLAKVFGGLRRPFSIVECSDCWCVSLFKK